MNQSTCLKFPTVSILIPIYKTTEESCNLTISSLVKQTNKNFEVIIVVDGVYDKTSSYIISEMTKELGSNRVRSVVLTDNYGPSVTRNVAFQISKGDIISYLDVGDELSEDRIEKLILLFTEYDIDILFSAYTIVEENNHHLLDHINFINRASIQGYQYIELLYKQNISIPLGVAHKRKPFVLCGGFQPGIVCGEDGILWRRMLKFIDPIKIMFSDIQAGTYFVSLQGQSRTQRRFDIGGFAFDVNHKNGSHGIYLDDDWFTNFHSKNWYD